MSTYLRYIFIAVSLLLLAEDYQYLLKIGDVVGTEQTLSKKLADFEDSECDDETNDEKEADKLEKKEKDENNYPAHGLVLDAGQLLPNVKICLVLAPLSKLAHELESPPPEV